MKLLMILGIAGLSSFCCVAQSGGKPFTIDGTIANTTSQYITLMNLDSRKTDSARIEKGRFVFNGSITEPVRVVLQLPINRVIDDSKNPNITDFYIVPGHMTVSLVQDHFKDIKISGSPVQNKYAELIHLFKKIDADSPSADKDAVKIVSRFIRENPDSYISISQLKSLESKMPIDTVKALFQLISTNLKLTRSGQQVALFIKGNDENADGRMAKAFNALNVKGEKISLSNFAGSYVLLDFWGSWCIPCRESMPQLKRLYQKYQPKGFEVIAVAQEYVQSDSLWKAAIEKDGTGIWQNIRSGRKYNGDNNFDDSNSIVKAYSVNIFPTKILIDKTGRIVRRFNGGDHEKEMEDLLAEIFRD